MLRSSPTSTLLCYFTSSAVVVARRRRPCPQSPLSSSYTAIVRQYVKNPHFRILPVTTADFLRKIYSQFTRCVIRESGLTITELELELEQPHIYNPPFTATSCSVTAYWTEIHSVLTFCVNHINHVLSLCLDNKLYSDITIIIALYTR